MVNLSADSTSPGIVTATVCENDFPSIVNATVAPLLLFTILWSAATVIFLLLVLPVTLIPVPALMVKSLSVAAPMLTLPADDTPTSVKCLLGVSSEEAFPPIYSFLSYRL